MDFSIYGQYACHDAFEEEQHIKQLCVLRVFGLHMVRL